MSPAPKDENGCPVDSTTSRARTIRREFPGSMRAAATGSTAASRAYAFAKPASVAVSTSSAARAVRVPGRDLQSVDDRPDVQPGPTDEQRPLAARFDVGDRGRGPRPASRVTDHSSLGSATSIRWCGTAARSATDGLAVPMSMPRYTCMESSETISTSPSAAATARATADFPDAVGPTIARCTGHTTATGIRTRRRGAGFTRPHEVGPQDSGAPRW